MGGSPNFSKNAKRDYNLVLKALQGDANAYASLMSFYKDSVYYMLVKMVSNKSDAEDLAIEAFGKAFKNLKLYAPTYAFSTWLFKIASNNAIDFLRSRRSKQKYISIDGNINSYENEEIYGAITLSSQNLDPEEEMIKEQKKQLMRKIVASLNPTYREIILLRYFKEYSYIEISEALKLPIGTVKARLYRSRELLQHILKDLKNGSI